MGILPAMPRSRAPMSPRTSTTTTSASYSAGMRSICSQMAAGIDVDVTQIGGRAGRGKIAVGRGKALRQEAVEGVGGRLHQHADPQHPRRHHQPAAMTERRALCSTARSAAERRRAS